MKAARRHVSFEQSLHIRSQYTHLFANCSAISCFRDYIHDFLNCRHGGVLFQDYFFKCVFYASYAPGHIIIWELGRQGRSQ